METEEPALVLDTIERRVPLHGLAHVGDSAHDERVETAADIAFPAGHGRNVGLHWGVTVGLRDLGVAAREESHLRAFAKWRLWHHLAAPGRLRIRARARDR